MAIIFSFIIPHHNCPNLLKRCIDSIPQGDDIQIIVVDDNSDIDKRPDLSERQGLEVISLDASQSKGAGRARNVGIEKAKGFWVLFADADDFFIMDDLNNLLIKYRNVRDFDVIYLNAISFVGDSENPSEIQPRIKRIYNQKSQLGGKFDDYIRFETWEPWTRMCRRDFLIENQITFDELPRQNDLSFGLKVSVFAKKWFFEEKDVYCWIEWPQTLSRKEVVWDSFKDLLNIRYNINKLYRSRKLQRRECFLYYIYLSIKWLGVKSTFAKTFPYLAKKHINPFSGLMYFIRNKF